MTPPPSDPMEGRRLRRIVIVGGGTAGWVSAAMLARALAGLGIAIALIEAPDIPTVGVGEATIPPFVDLLAFLGIDQADFIRHTRATLKLGIRFDGWQGAGSRYWHPFGTFGETVARRPFFHLWQRAVREGRAPRLADYSACTQLGEAGQVLVGDAAAAAGVRHALHFDATLVAAYLRRYALALGVVRHEATVTGVDRDERGLIEQLRLAGESTIAGDLFLDATGFRALVAEGEAGAGWIDWSDLLPCDTAITVPSEAEAAPAPFTRAVAMAAGWRWRIPLQHRTGNGYVCCSGAAGAASAEAELVAAIGEPADAPRTLRFRAGRRQRFWSGNCVSVGLASGFIEPLESTSIHLVVSAIHALIAHLPDRDVDPRLADAYNRVLIDEIEQARDFVFLHYHLSERDDTPFWRQMRATPPPDSLHARLELYRASGRIPVRPGELFTDLSWFYVLEGMGRRPRGYDPLIDAVPAADMAPIMAAIAAHTARACRGAPAHADLIAAMVRGRGA